MPFGGGGGMSRTVEGVARPVGRATGGRERGKERTQAGGVSAPRWGREEEWRERGAPRGWDRREGIEAIDVFT